jgi:hypothetical protein
LESLGEAVEGLMNGHNLGNDKHRKLWNALTGTSLENEPFWSQFQSASKKRNSIVHGGKHANKVEAEAALRASTDRNSPEADLILESRNHDLVSRSQRAALTRYNSPC